MLTDAVELRALAYDHEHAATRAEAHGRSDWADALRSGWELAQFELAGQLRPQRWWRWRERLDALDVDALSPREALDLLYELKREAGKLP